MLLIAEWSWDFLVRIHFFSSKDNNATVSNNLSLRVDKVATFVYSWPSGIFKDEITILFPSIRHYYKVSILVNFKLARNVSYCKFRKVSHSRWWQSLSFLSVLESLEIVEYVSNHVRAYIPRSICEVVEFIHKLRVQLTVILSSISYLWVMPWISRQKVVHSQQLKYICLHCSFYHLCVL